MLQLNGLSLWDCADWFCGGAWCWTGWWVCWSGGGDIDCCCCCDCCWCVIVCNWTCCGIFCGDAVGGRCCIVVVFVLWTVTVGCCVCWTAVGSVTITTPVPLHVEHLVTVVTFFFLAATFAGNAFWIWMRFWASFTSNFMSPSCETKICVGRTFCAFVSFCMHVSHRISFGPFRFAFCMCPPHDIHFCLSAFCWDCCCWTICSFIVWCNWAGSSDSVATICMPRFWPLSVIRFCAWMMFGCCVTTVTVSLCDSSWLCVLLCWFRSVKWGNIWLQTSHLKLMLDIVF